MKESSTFQCVLTAYQEHLKQEEKSTATVEKYLREARAFVAFMEEKDCLQTGTESGQAAQLPTSMPLTKELTLAYKQHLLEQNYAVRSVNAKLAALNNLLTYLGRPDCRVRSLKCQRQAYRPVERELTKAEYLRLLAAADQKPQLRLVMQTICATGIRVSELQHFTVEAIRRGEISVSCKGKHRQILIPGKLRKLLLDYCRHRQIRTGPIFITRTGHPLDRSYIWAQMKRLCQAAGVEPGKVFPHNLRKLFARTFYQLERDIAKLADILGHSSIDTTRIYIMTTGVEHRKKMERLGLVV